MMTIGIPKAPWKPEPTVFYVPRTEVTRTALRDYHISDDVIEFAMGETWPIEQISTSVFGINTGVSAAVGGPMSGWFFPIAAVQLL